ncbi:hypothetical protein [Microvirga sp. TS319]|uniref:hypothetical protein n=1 Tax=Microvirga sp. TS319 TaxID=3241165 RepID=UPI003519F82F
MQDETKRDLDFSPEEWSIIVGFSSWRGTAGNRLGWYASALGAVVTLGAYGAWKGDIIAVGLAFICLPAYVLWLSIGQLRGIQIYQSIFSKIVAFKEPSEPSPALEDSPDAGLPLPAHQSSP